MATVSIIVPVYNAEKYLSQTLDSVLSQTFSDWELIIIDDGSTDDSNRICHQYRDKDKRIILIEKKNSGVSNARNSALDIAHGKFIFFLDADDELYPYSLAHLVEVISKNDADIVIGRQLYSCEKPEVSFPEQPYINITDAITLCRDILYQKPNTDNGPWAKLFTRSLFDNIRFYDGWFEDLEILPKLIFSAKRIVLTDVVVYYYRKHPESFINSWSDGRKEIIGVTEKIIADMKKQQPALIKAAEHRHFSASFNLLIGLIRNNPSDKETIEKCYQTIKSLRTQIIIDSNSRWKNREGALASFFGFNFLSRLIKWTTK